MTWRDITYTKWDYQKKKNNRTEEITIMAENFLQINVRHQTTDPGSPENTKQGKCQKQNKTKQINKATIPRHIIFKLQKTREKNKHERSQHRVGITYLQSKYK